MNYSPFFLLLFYVNVSRKQVEESRKEAEREGIVVPRTVSEYCIKTRLPSKDSNASNEINDLFFDEDYDDEDNDDYIDEDDDD